MDTPRSQAWAFGSSACRLLSLRERIAITGTSRKSMADANCCRRQGRSPTRGKYSSRHCGYPAFAVAFSTAWRVDSFTRRGLINNRQEASAVAGRAYHLNYV